MADFDKLHVIHSEGDGVLGETTIGDVDQLAQHAAQQDHLVIHLHGGLVPFKSGLGLAERLTPYYQENGIHPVFFVWETGGFETVFNNIGQIVKEEVFKAVLAKVLKWLGGKANEAAGSKSISGLIYPTDLDVERGIRYIAQDAPEDEWNPSFEGIEDLTDDELLAFEQEVMSDDRLGNALAAISNATEYDGAKNIFVAKDGEATTLMSPGIIGTFAEVEDVDRSKGLFSWAGIARLVVKILRNCVRRFVRGRGHGAYTTVIEETLYALYVVNVPAIGGAVWRSMKNDAKETFDPDTDERPRAGRRFWNELAEELKSKPNLKVSIVAHSAGAIFASHMIEHIGELKAEGRLAKDFSLHKTVFLAPAVRSDLLAQTLDEHEDVVGDFRMYTMTDAAERGYWEVIGYRGSLLYIVSGLFEKGDRLHDVGLAGMARYTTRTKTYKADEFEFLQDYFATLGRVIWSPNANPTLGESADSEKHGNFDQTDHGEITMQSVRHFLTN